MYIDALTITGAAVIVGLVAWIAFLYHKDPGNACPEPIALR